MLTDLTTTSSTTSPTVVNTHDLEIGLITSISNSKRAKKKKRTNDVNSTSIAEEKTVSMF